MKTYTWKDLEVKIGDQVIKPIRSVDYRDQPIYPAWSGTKRKLCPVWLFLFVMSSRAMGWHRIDAVLRWLVCKTNKPSMGIFLERYRIAQHPDESDAQYIARVRDSLPRKD